MLFNWDETRPAIHNFLDTKRPVTSVLTVPDPDCNFHLLLEEMLDSYIDTVDGALVVDLKS